MPDLTSEERTRVETAAAWLRDFVTRIEELRMSAHVADGSARAIDAASEATDIGFEIAGLKLSAADDYLSTVAVLMSGAIPRYGCYVLLRSALEAAAVTYWLMQPGQADVTRQARSITAQLMNVQSTKGADPDRDIEPRIREFRARAAAIKAGDVLDRRGRLIGFGERRPSMTAMVRSLPTLDHIGRSGRHAGDWAYNALSAFAHAEMWAVLQGQRIVTPGETHSILELSVKVNSLLHFVSVSAAAVDVATAAWMGLMAGNAPGWIRKTGEIPDL